jgi:hypothetical protein
MTNILGKKPSAPSTGEQILAHIKKQTLLLTGLVGEEGVAQPTAVDTLIQLQEQSVASIERLREMMEEMFTHLPPPASR